MSKRLAPCLISATLLLASPASAQEREVPYWASIRVDEVNMRVGPGEDYRISWVYSRVNLPLRVVRVKEGWRLVEDPDGARGWVLGRFLSLKRGAIVTGKGLAEIREKPESGARMLWRVEPGVVGQLGDCEAGWCRFEVDAHAGFVQADRLWGDGAP